MWLTSLCKQSSLVNNMASSPNASDGILPPPGAGLEARGHSIPEVWDLQ